LIVFTYGSFTEVSKSAYNGTIVANTNWKRSERKRSRPNSCQNVICQGRRAGFWARIWTHVV